MNWNLAGLNIALLIATLIAMPVYDVEIPVDSIPEIPDIDRTVLPDSYPVYTNGSLISNHPKADYTEKFLPTNNKYTGNPGCYVACYSSNPAAGIYVVSGKYFVVGQVRVAGSYDASICKPVGYEKKDLSKEPKYLQLCSNSFKRCKNGSCHAGGDTGGWFAGT